MSVAYVFVLLFVYQSTTIIEAHNRENPLDVIAMKHARLDNDTKQYLCDLCTDAVSATEEYIGAEGRDGLDNLVEKCIAAIAKGTTKGFGQFICDTLFADNVRGIIRQLNDQSFRTQEAAKVCGQIGACPSVYPTDGDVDA